MLGKTNINTLTEGTIVTEIEDYRWIQMKSGIFGDFVKAIYKNDYLVAITTDGKVVYTTDGEVWHVSAPEYKDCKLCDIDFDGGKFILVGNFMGTKTYSDGTTEETQAGLILITSDFIEYEKKEMESLNGTHCYNYLAVYPKNGKHIVISAYGGTYSNYRNFFVSIGSLYNNEWENEYSVPNINIEYLFSTAKNSQYMLICAREKMNSTGAPYETYVVGIREDTASRFQFKVDNCSAKAFECKDELYYISSSSADNYKFARLLSSGSSELISNNINYMFVDGVYFNGCQIFINAHEMLVVKKGENIADKTLDDLIEIAPELSMNCIAKAFGQLYIFGNQGVILKSSVETNNEEAIVVQTLSAKKALAEAKAYADERYEALEERIVALEKLKAV